MQYNNVNRLCADFLIYEQADGINHIFGRWLVYGTWI